MRTARFTTLARRATRTGQRGSATPSGQSPVDDEFVLGISGSETKSLEDVAGAENRAGRVVSRAARRIADDYRADSLALLRRLGRLLVRERLSVRRLPDLPPHARSQPVPDQFRARGLFHRDVPDRRPDRRLRRRARAPPFLHAWMHSARAGLHGLFLRVSLSDVHSR